MLRDEAIENLLGRLDEEPVYLAGMRQTMPGVCWRLIDDGKAVCILDRGHDDGVHEETNERKSQSWNPTWQELNDL